VPSYNPLSLPRRDPVVAFVAGFMWPTDISDNRQNI
jgi:hypothetical protein